MGTQNRRVREFERRERDILAAAEDLFQGGDWESVTIEQISQRAEIGKGTVYTHFKSKQEIYARLALGFQSALLDSWGEIDPALPVLEKMRRVLRATWDAHLGSHTLHQLVTHCARPEFRKQLAPETALEFEAQELRFGETLGQLLREGIEQGLFPNRPLERLIIGPRAAFWGAVQLAWSGSFPEQDRDRRFEELARFMIAGLMQQNLPADF